MIKTTKEQLIPTNDNVIVEIDESKDFIKGVYIPNDSLSKTNANYYKGIIYKTGPKAKSLVEGNRTMINKFAGAHINTGKSGFVKCVELNEISITYKDKMTKDTLYVHGDRILVELVADSTMTESGLYKGNINSNDPRELEMQSGRIVKLGDYIVANDFNKGDIVSFDSYCGMEFQDDDGIVYKVLNEYDIRFKTK